MGRVGIVTINDNSNFGNRLQNYALQEVIRSMGHEPITVRNDPLRGGASNPLVRRWQILRANGASALRGRVKRAIATHSAIDRVRNDPRLEGNAAFTAERINESDVRFDEIDDAKAFARDYHKFVVGSDQVWNPRFRLLNSIDFLTFTEPEQRVAYAASFGLGSLPRNVRKRYSRYLAGIPTISVREHAAAHIVEELTGRRVPVVLDPTLLLGGDKWANLATLPAGFNDAGYVARFLLEETNDADSDHLEDFARRSGLRLVDINFTKSGERFCTTPTDFLGLIQNAALVATDSFHASVFSILFRTPFVIRRRDEMHSRFETLSRISGVSLPTWQTLSDVETIDDANWRDVDRNLANARDQSMNYLTIALA